MTALARERGRRSTKAVQHQSPRHHEALIPAPSKQAAAAQSVLMVDLASAAGHTWSAVGVGDTLAEALAFAEDSCPTDETWHPISWNDLYGG